MIWSIAWRNVWRNRVRSLVVMGAIATGLFAGVFSTGFYKGMADMRLDSGIRSEVSHIQIHLPEYRLNNEIHLFIPHGDSLRGIIAQTEGVRGVSRRLIADGFMKSAHGTRGIRLIGIEPEYEKQVTDISEHLLEGNYLSDEKRIPGILIGQKLADKLRLRLGSKVPVDLVDAEGNLSSKLFKVRGIFKTSNTGYDERNAFVRLEALQQQLAMPSGSAHEIAIYLENGMEVDNIAQSLQAQFPGLEVSTWRDLSKELAMLVDAMDQYMYIFVIIILLALCFGIINTMLMVVMERVKELGMLMAVGMERLRVFFMIVLESVFLSFTGGIAGILVGYLVIRHYETTPIRLRLLEGFEAYGYSSEIYTSIEPGTMFAIAGLVLVLGVVSSFYPAWKAIKLDPADALRTE
ncbi:MAG: ABC transporter permease [Bacteroidales bacterium]